MRHRALVAILTLWAVLLAACGTETGEEDGMDDARRTLEHQRTDVRRVAADLAPSMAAAVGGTVTFLTGQWSGCDSVFPQGHRNFRYGVRGRIDATTPGAAGLDAVVASWREAGLQVEQPAPESSAPGQGSTRSGPLTRSAEEGGVQMSVTAYADQEFLLIGFQGPCVDVPRSQREEWEERKEGEPDVRLTR